LLSQVVAVVVLTELAALVRVDCLTKHLVL
jgi:hypothetical protein